MNSFFDYIAESEVADEWLHNHVRHNLDKYPSLEVIDDLLHEYPYTKGATLYRGLNFADEEQYRTFLANTDNGTMLKTKSISSWTPDRHQATQFAVTRPTYFINAALMQAESEKEKQRDYMIGAAGIVIQLEPEAGKCIDVTSSKLAAENEVIVIPGEYKISINKTYIPFVKSIDDENYEEVLQGIESLDSGFNKQKLFHIIFRFADLSNDAKQKIWDLYGFKGKLQPYVDLKDYSVLGNGEMRLHAGFNLPDGLMYCYRFLLPEHQQVIRSAIKTALLEITKQIDKIVKEKELDYRKLRIFTSHDVKLGEVITGINAFKNIDRELGNMYRELNSAENIKSINDLPHEEKVKAIQNFSNDLITILNSLAKK